MDEIRLHGPRVAQDRIPYSGSVSESFPATRSFRDFRAAANKPISQLGSQIGFPINDLICSEVGVTFIG
jgi:hypothetical protein